MEKVSTSRDNFSDRVKSILAKRVGTRCSNPNCPNETSGPHTNDEQAVNIGVAAHITAAIRGGPRFDENMSSRERSSAKNGIWLCQNCAKLIDSDEERYSVILILRWKKHAEDLMQKRLENSRAEEKRTFEVVIPNKLLDTNLTKECPFQLIGPLTIESKSYIDRRCDLELKRDANIHSFIWLKGDFQFGKTSLLNRHSFWLGSEWQPIFIDLQGCQRASDSRFREDFFSEIAEVIGTKCDWQRLKNSIRKRKIAFLLDEFGSGKPSQLLEMLEHFHSLAAAAPNNMKIVVSYRKGPEDLLPVEQFEDPKYRGVWKVIRLDTLNTTEVESLFILFPDNVSALLKKNYKKIEKATNGEPQKVQKMLKVIWDEWYNVHEDISLLTSFVHHFLNERA